MQNIFIIILFIFAQLFSENKFTPSSKNTTHHIAYSFSYSEPHEQAQWISYRITKNQLNLSKIKRTNDFRPDTSVKTGSATLADYKGSGFDRGHLAPVAIFKYSKKAMSESFFLSNISPQGPGFNQGIWKKLEKKVRQWAKENDTLYIISGPILKDGLKTIGKNKVSIPDYYYKAILDYTKPEYKAIGFMLPNKKSKLPIMNYAVTIDFIEALTGIDFSHSCQIVLKYA